MSRSVIIEFITIFNSNYYFLLSQNSKGVCDLIFLYKVTRQGDNDWNE
jgi:hypothetical protein